jgi:hypothetical protein
MIKVRDDNLVKQFSGLQKWTDALESRGVTFEQFTQKVGVEIIRPSMQRFQRLTFNEDQTIPTKVS